MMNARYLTVWQFAAHMGVSCACIRTAIKKGKINAFRPGAGKRSPWRIPESEIERLQVMGKEDSWVEE